MKNFINLVSAISICILVFACTKETENEKLSNQAALKNCCSSLTITQTSVSTGDGCCHVTVKIKNNWPFGPCIADVTDPSGGLIGSIAPFEEKIFNFYPCPPSDVPGSYSGGTYSIFVNGSLCKTFKVQAICAF